MGEKLREGPGWPWLEELGWLGPGSDGCNCLQARTEVNSFRVRLRASFISSSLADDFGLAETMLGKRR
jgi:hypothetical protein